MAVMEAATTHKAKLALLKTTTRERYQASCCFTVTFHSLAFYAGVLCNLPFGVPVLDSEPSERAGSSAKAPGPVIQIAMLELATPHSVCDHAESHERGI